MSRIGFLCLEKIKSEAASSIERRCFILQKNPQKNWSHIRDKYFAHSLRYSVARKRLLVKGILSQKINPRKSRITGSNARGLFSSAIRAMLFLRNAELRNHNVRNSPCAWLMDDYSISGKQYCQNLSFVLFFSPLPFLHLFSELGYVALTPRGY